MIDPFSLAGLPIGDTVYERRADGKIIGARRKLNRENEEFYVLTLNDTSDDAHTVVLERMIALTPREARRTIVALRRCAADSHQSGETK